MLSVKCKLCAFRNTAVTHTDYIHVNTYAIIACKKLQRTRRARKHTFTYTKKGALKFSISSPG